MFVCITIFIVIKAFQICINIYTLCVSHLVYFLNVNYLYKKFFPRLLRLYEIRYWIVAGWVYVLYYLEYVLNK